MPGDAAFRKANPALSAPPSIPYPAAMKHRLLGLLLWLAVPLAHAGLWTDDYAGALAQAKAENRFVLLDFTGSDWCGWCKRLEREVFSKDDFKKYAKANLVCVTLDFPRGFELKKKVAAQNEKLSNDYEVMGYPTIVLLDPNGKTIGRTGYQPGGAKAYVEHLETFIEPARKTFGPPKAGEQPATPPATPAPEAK